MARKINSLSDESLQKLKRELQKSQNSYSNLSRRLASQRGHEAVWMPTPSAAVRGYGTLSYTATENTSTINDVVEWTRHEEHLFVPCDSSGEETDDGPYFKAAKNCKCMLFCHMQGQIPDRMPTSNVGLNSVGIFRFRRKRGNTDYRHYVANMENEVRLVGNYMVQSVNTSAGLVTSVDYAWATNAGFAGGSATYSQVDVSSCNSFHVQKDDIYYFKFFRAAMHSDYGGSLITFVYNIYFQIWEMGNHAEFETGSISDYESNWENL